MGSGLPRPSECTDCQAPIRFVMLPSSKHMPVNPLPNPLRGTVAARRLMGRLDGYVVSSARAAAPDFPLMFTPHYATCPARAEEREAAAARAEVEDQVESDPVLF